MPDGKYVIKKQKRPRGAFLRFRRHTVSIRAMQAKLLLVPL